PSWRSRAEHLPRSWGPVQLDENGSSLLGPAPPHGREGSFDVAGADMGGDPDGRFQAHYKFSSCPPRPSRIDHMCEGDESPDRHFFDYESARATKSYSSGRPVIAASSRTSRSEGWPVIGSLRSRSNFSIAAWVSAATVPLALI